MKLKVLKNPVLRTTLSTGNIQLSYKHVKGENNKTKYVKIVIHSLNRGDEFESKWYETKYSMEKERKYYFRIMVVLSNDFTTSENGCFV